MIATVSKTTLKTQLANAEQQESLLGKQYFDACKALESLEVGTPQHLEQSTLAADITNNLSAIRAEIERLKQALKTDAQRQKEADAQRQKEQVALTAQLDKDEATVMAIIERINTASDELAAALIDYHEANEARISLNKGGRLNTEATGLSFLERRNLQLPYARVGNGRLNIVTRGDSKQFWSEKPHAEN